VQRVVITDDNFVSDHATTPASIHLDDDQPSQDFLSDESSTLASIHLVDDQLSTSDFVSNQSTTTASIHLVDGGTNTNWPSNQSSTPPSIHLVDGRPSTLRCVTFGGYPPPNVELFVGRRDVTAEFHFFSNASLSGRRGLRQITYRSERWTHSFLPDSSDDQARLKCIATVVGLKLESAVVLLSIDCELLQLHFMFCVFLNNNYVITHCLCIFSVY